MVMPGFLTNIYFDNELYRYLIFLGISLGSILVAKILYWIFEKIIKRITEKTKTRLDDLIIEVSKKPVVVYIVLLGIEIGFQFLKFPNYPKIPIYYGHLMYMAVLINSAWFVSRLVRAFIENYIKPLAAKTDNDLDDSLAPIINRLISIAVYIIAIIMILQHFGQEIGPLLAGLGIGGLAFALAAKDLLSNLFGSFTIIFDKPFKTGNRIKIGDYDGFVEQINLRTTKVKTLEGRRLYIPNAKFTDEIVENVSQEWARKIKMEIGLTYDTNAAKIKKAKEILKKILIGHKNVDSENVLVYFTEFGPYSKNILVIYWITDKDNFLKVKDDVNMKIMQEFDKAKLDMAFPTQTLEVKKIK